MRLALIVALGAVVVSVAPGCSTPSPVAPLPLPISEGCQPLGPEAEVPATCALPYPSDFFRVADSSTRTGYRVALTGAAKLVTPLGVDADASGAFPTDGASLNAPVTAVLPDEVVAEGLPSVLDDPARSMDISASPTLLLRADTFEAIAHYVDIDTRPDDAAHVAMTMHPLVRLQPATRYLVVLRGVKNARGAKALPAEGFRRLRDRETGLDPKLAALAQRYETEIFAPLAAKKIARNSMQLAWDFSTGSVEAPQASMLEVRELTRDWLARHSPAVEITRIDPGTGQYWRLIHGTVTGPLLLDKAGPGGRLFRGPDGKIAHNGEATFPFIAAVPIVVRDQLGPGKVLAVGHGFFGDLSEVDSLALQGITSAVGAIAFGIDWWGMSKDDFGSVAAGITDTPAHAMDFVERVHQSVANWLVMTAAIKGPIAKQPAFARPASGEGVSDNGGVSNAGALLYDPSHAYYFGASQGHILGGTMAAMNPDIERAVLNVGGASWTQMMPRAQPFTALQFFVKSSVKSELAAQALLGMSTAQLDRIDPATFAPLLVGSKLPGNPDRRVIIQMGIGDPLVPNVSNQFHVRALGLSQTAPNSSPVWGVPDADPATLTSGYSIWDYGVDISPWREARPLLPNVVHDSVRRDPRALAQMAAFLDPAGVVIRPCPATCTGQ